MTVLTRSRAATEQELLAMRDATTPSTSEEMASTVPRIPEHSDTEEEEATVRGERGPLPAFDSGEEDSDDEDDSDWVPDRQQQSESDDATVDAYDRGYYDAYYRDYACAEYEGRTQGFIDGLKLAARDALQDNRDRNMWLTLASPLMIVCFTLGLGLGRWM